MKSIIIGAGEVGFQLAKVLLAENYDVVIIDQSEVACQRLSNNLDLMTFCGSGASPSLLETAGISDTDLLIAVTDSDEINILACLIASHCNVKNKIARVANTNYFSDNQIITVNDLGIDHLISSERLCAREFIRLLKAAEAREVVEFAKGRVQLIAFHVQEDNPIIGCSIEELSHRKMFSQLRFVAIKQKDGDTILPKGKDEIQPRDEVFVMGSRSAISDLLKISGISPQHNLERLVIAGATAIGIEISKMLESEPVKVTIIEPNLQNAEEASSTLTKATVLNGSFLDRQILAEAGISEADSFVSVTGDDEDDIMSCVMAKAEGAQRTMPLVQEPSYLPILASITEIDSAVSRHLTLVNDILRLLRRGDVLSAILMRDVDAEVLEFVVHKKSKINGEKIHSIHFPHGAVIGAIVRSSEVIVPTGEIAIQSEDHVVVFSQPEAIPKVESLFA